MSPADTLREIAAMVPGSDAASDMLAYANRVESGTIGPRYAAHSLRWWFSNTCPWVATADERAALELAIEALS